MYACTLRYDAISDDKKLLVFLSFMKFVEQSLARLLCKGYKALLCFMFDLTKGVFRDGDSPGGWELHPCYSYEVRKFYSYGTTSIRRHPDG